MISVYVPDVGDGLALGLWTIGHEKIQIDCGSQQNPDAALMKGLRHIYPDVFVLSHFHSDHYNGLLQWDPRHHDFNPLIETVYFPRVPVFPERMELRREFVMCMLAMQHWVMGDTTGNMEADFLGVVSRINSRPFIYHALSMGDTMRIGSSRFEVLWPPRIVEDKGTLSVVRTAVSDFEKAAEENESLRRLREQIGERGEIQPYLGTENEEGMLPGRGEEDHERDILPSSDGRGQIPESVRHANDSLRRAANHLSISFHQDNRFLFMGDLESHEIAKVVQNLLKEDRKHFVIMIAPHHGTHWHKDLGRLRSWWVMSSAGGKLFRHVSPNFKSMCRCHLVTYLNGDIDLPLHIPPWQTQGFW